MPPSPGALIKALGSEDLAILVFCGHSDTLSSRKMNSTRELFGLYLDFQEGHAYGPMGLLKLWKKTALESPPGFVPRWLGDKREAA